MPQNKTKSGLGGFCNAIRKRRVQTTLPVVFLSIFGTTHFTILLCCAAESELLLWYPLLVGRLSTKEQSSFCHCVITFFLLKTHLSFAIIKRPSFERTVSRQPKPTLAVLTTVSPPLPTSNHCLPVLHWLATRAMNRSCLEHLVGHIAIKRLPPAHIVLWAKPCKSRPAKEGFYTSSGSILREVVHVLMCLKNRACVYCQLLSVDCEPTSPDQTASRSRGLCVNLPTGDGRPGLVSQHSGNHPPSLHSK